MFSVCAWREGGREGGSRIAARAGGPRQVSTDKNTIIKLKSVFPGVILINSFFSLLVAAIYKNI